MRVPDDQLQQQLNIPLPPSQSTSPMDNSSTNGSSNLGATTAAPSGAANISGAIKDKGKAKDTSNGITTVAHVKRVLPKGGGMGGTGTRPAVTRVNPPGTTIYPDSTIDREEFIRLVVQSLRDIGYIESATTLEAESGISLESFEVSQFRDAVMEGQWSRVIKMLPALGVVDRDISGARFLISQQHYLELLESKQIGKALQVLRSELTPLSVDSVKLHGLASLMMCMDPNDLLSRAKWDGAKGTSRQRLLVDLQAFIPHNAMVPPRRLNTLLEQARNYQKAACTYHDPRAPFSFLSDHECSRAQFPTVTTHLLMGHSDEVWNIAWSHDGRYLASASKDKSAIIWSIGPETDPSIRDCKSIQQLRDHEYQVGIVAWSLDDKVLITGAEQILKMWNVETGLFIREMEGHTEGVSAIIPLPDGSGYVSGGMDHKIIFWDIEGKQKSIWPGQIRILDLAVSPDGSKLVVVGVMDPGYEPQSNAGNGVVGAAAVRPSGLSIPYSSSSSSISATGSASGGASVGPGSGPSANGSSNGPVSAADLAIMRRRIAIYDLKTKEEIAMIPMLGELTSVSISADSKYALINHSPDDVQLWDMETRRMVRKYTGQRQERHIIRSCFGGADGDFILSGSEDSKVYIWRRDTGSLMEVLSGHQHGIVNAVAWNPREVGMFASCSDDSTIRIWEAPTPGMESLESMPLDLPQLSAGSKLDAAAASSVSDGQRRAQSSRWNLGLGSNPLSIS
ncbi:hypothetical protein FRC02_009671 [Tulasnella sp. 418]|nr:hypothetical protein FRC02_009671 [Tulasnella sp. 418]